MPSGPWMSVLKSSPTPAKVGMTDLMRRIDVVYKACGGGEKEKDDAATEGMDDFGKMKYEIAQKVIEIREDIKRRDHMAANRENGASRTEILKLSQKIRKDIKAIQEQEQQLQEIFKKMQRKKTKKKSKAEEDAMAKRQEILEVIRLHVKEVERLDKRRFERRAIEQQQQSNNNNSNSSRNSGRQSRRDNSDNNNSDLASARKKRSSNNNNETEMQDQQQPSSSSEYDDLPDDPTDTNLPEIDVSDVLKQIKEKDSQIDKGLDQISKRVSKLKDIATEMNDELKKQAVMTEAIEKDIDRAQAKIETLNEKLQGALQKAGGVNRFIAVVVLLVILLALLGVIYFVFRSNFFMNFA